MVDTFIAYIRTLHFSGPEIERRYYRLFGDLEYDLLSLRVESRVMDQRLREVRRRLVTAVPISTEDERRISTTSHELNEHLYTRLQRLHARIATAKSFRYDPESEVHGCYLLRDIALAVMGLADPAARLRNRTVLDDACEAYARLDIATLLDLHESVQGLLACERREGISRQEERLWHHQLTRLTARHPLCSATIMDQPERIAAHTEALHARIRRAQRELVSREVLYAGVIRVLRFRN